MSKSDRQPYRPLFLGGLAERLDDLIDLQIETNRILSKMSAQLDALIAQVAENTAVEASAIELIQRLADKIIQLAGDPVAIANLAAQLKASADALAAAVIANTPAAE